MTKEIELTQSNIRLPTIEGPINQEAFDIYKNMLNASASVFGKEICSLCAKQKGQLRTHFHGSEFGKCIRQTYFNMLAGPKDIELNPTGQNAVFLHDGHLHEDAIRQMLSANYVLTHTDEELIINREVQLLVDKNLEPIIINVQIVMHTDNLLATHNKIPLFVLEYKAVKNWYFKERAKKGIISQHYYGQSQIYTEAYNLEHTLLFFKNRESSEILPPFIIQRDPYYIRKRFTYLAGILYSIMNRQSVPNEYTDPKCDACKFCDHYNKCWGD